MSLPSSPAAQLWPFNKASGFSTCHHRPISRKELHAQAMFVNLGIPQCVNGISCKCPMNQVCCGNWGAINWPWQTHSGAGTFSLISRSTSATAFSHHPTYILFYIKHNPQIITYIPYCLYRKKGFFLSLRWHVGSLQLQYSSFLILNKYSTAELNVTKHWKLSSMKLFIIYFQNTQHFCNPHFL